VDTAARYHAEPASEPPDDDPNGRHLRSTLASTPRCRWLRSSYDAPGTPGEVGRCSR
jgi:hypothetical protein